MKFQFLFFVVSIVTLTSCSSTQSRQEPHEPELQTQNLSKDQLHKVLLGRYQVIAGAWYINKNCRVLGNEQSEKFEKYVGDLNVYAQNNQLAPTQHLLLMQQNARFGASLEKYASCDEEAESVVKGSYALAEMLHQDLVQVGAGG